MVATHKLLVNQLNAFKYIIMLIALIPPTELFRFIEPFPVANMSHSKLFIPPKILVKLFISKRIIDILYWMNKTSISIYSTKYIYKPFEVVCLHLHTVKLESCMFGCMLGSEWNVAQNFACLSNNRAFYGPEVNF